MEPDVLLSRVVKVVNDAAGLYVVQWMANTMVARAMFPDMFTYSIGDPVVVERVSSSSELLILGSID